MTMQDSQPNEGNTVNTTNNHLFFLIEEKIPEKMVAFCFVVKYGIASKNLKDREK